MRWLPRFAVAVVAIAMIAIAAPPMTSASAAGPTTLTVTPHTGLSGGDTVTLHGTGFKPSEGVLICEGIITDHPSPSDCGTSFHDATTDGNGAFTTTFNVFRFITPGSENSTVDCAGGSVQCGMGAGDGDVLAVAPITFASQPPPAIEGTVTDAGGNPVAGALVWAYTSSDGYVGSLQTTTNAQGMYELDVNLNTTYALRFSPPPGPTDLVAEWFDNQTNRRSSNVRLGGAFNVFTANAQLDAGGEIQGTLEGAGVGAVAGATVSAYGPGDGFVASFGTKTTTNGQYVIDGVRPGSYRLRFVPPAGANLASGWFFNVNTAATATTLTVAAGATTTVPTDTLGGGSG